MEAQLAKKKKKKDRGDGEKAQDEGEAADNDDEIRDEDEENEEDEMAAAEPVASTSSGRPVTRKVRRSRRIRPVDGFRAGQHWRRVQYDWAKKMQAKIDAGLYDSEFV